MSQYRKSPRAKFIDYNHGHFFITICTDNKKHLFGTILYNEIILTDLGKFVERQLQNAEALFQGIYLSAFVVMPNHVHLVVCVKESAEKPESTLPGNIMRDPNSARRGDEPRSVPIVSRYINSLKGCVTKYARKSGIEKVWHGRYNDRKIRDIEEYDRITAYIENNVSTWMEDKYGR